MPSAIWPPSLPGFVEIPGYDETLPFTALRTNMDRGPAKQRSVSTADAGPIRFVSDIMNPTQYATFLAFYKTTLLNGALPFDWVDPLTQNAVTYRFTAGPKPIPLGGGNCRVQLPLEKMP